MEIYKAITERKSRIQEKYLMELFKGSKNKSQHNSIPELRNEIEINRKEVEITVKQLIIESYQETME